ncbi:hypothetical protein KA005_76710, partial [bacterium]|nr:hypothetical protein [bacterium]
MEISRSMFSQRNADILEQFSGYFEKPDTLQKALRKRVEDLKPMANMVKAVIEMPGWKEVIGPFLETESNQINQFKIFESDVDEKVKYMKLGQSKAFFQFLMLIRNLVA